MDALDSLDSQQREILQHYCSLTGSEDLDEALRVLNGSGWNLQLAAARAFEGSPVLERMDLDDAVHGPRRPVHARQAPPRGLIDQIWLRVRPLVRLVGWPVIATFSLVSASFSMMARFLRIRPSLPNVSFRGGSRTAVAADPTSCAERFIRGLEEQAGVGGLPDFERCGYEEALRRAQRALRPMVAILISEEHDDTPGFIKTVLTDPELLMCFKQNNVLVWGGDIRDRDAYITSQTLEATTYPFLACITLQPPRAQPGMPPPTSKTPKMTLFSRLEGPPTSVTSATAIITHLNSTFIPRTSSYLDRLRAAQLSRDAERQLRAEQDAAYAAAGQRDAERIALRRAQAMAAEEAEDRSRALEQWRRWAAANLANEPLRGGTRLAVKLPDGRRIVRRFLEEMTTISDVYRWIEGEAFRDTTEGDASYPRGYEHQYDFKVAQMIPRRSLDIGDAGGSQTLQALGGFSGGANLVVEGLKLGTAQEDSDEELID